MANRIICEGIELDLDPALAAAENGNSSELAIAAWWANSIPVDESIELNIGSEVVASTLLLSGVAHAVARKREPKLTIDHVATPFSELLAPSQPKPPNADWFVYDDGTTKTRLLPNLEHPRTGVPPYDLQTNRYSWLWSLTPAYDGRQRLMSDLDTSLWQAVDNAHRHSAMGMNETGLAIVNSKDESTRDTISWTGQTTVIDGGSGIPERLADYGKRGFKIMLKTNRWTPERQEEVASDSEFALSSLIHLTSAKFMSTGRDGTAGRDSSIDPGQGYGLWDIAHCREAICDFTIATTDIASKGGANVAVSVNDAEDPVEKVLSLPSPAKGTMVHVNMRVERQSR